MDLVLAVLPHLPVPLHVVLEGDRSGNLQTSSRTPSSWPHLDHDLPSLTVEQRQEQDGVVTVTLHRGEEVLGRLPYLGLHRDRLPSLFVVLC